MRVDCRKTDTKKYNQPGWARNSFYVALAEMALQSLWEFILLCSLCSLVKGGFESTLGKSTTAEPLSHALSVSSALWTMTLHCRTASPCGIFQTHHLASTQTCWPLALFGLVHHSA